MFSGKLIRVKTSHHVERHKVAKANSHHAPIETHLQHLISECSSDLKKIPVDHQLKFNIKKLDDQYREKIYDEIKNQFNSLTDIFTPDDSLESKSRANGWELICGLESIRHFLDNYEIICPRMSLSAAINPGHLRELSQSFQTSFTNLKKEDRNLLASVIAPSVFNQLDVSLHANQRSISNLAYQKNQPQLNFDQLVSLLDCTHYATGTFNSVNCGLRVLEYNRIRTFADIVFCVQQPLIEALSLLNQKNEFLFKGDLIKGLRINDPGGPLRRVKLRTGNLVVFPHPTSSTSDPTKSYAQRGTHDSELVFLNGTGVKVHLFHNTLTMHESEVILPMQGNYRMVDSSIKNPKMNGGVERFYCEQVHDTCVDPDTNLCL